MKIKFWGAAQTVTGSSHLVELNDGRKLLLDCGLYQGREGFAGEYNTTFPCDPKEIDVMVLSHAHIDHCGRIPQLVKKGFKGDIYCTHATYDLCAIMLADSAKIQESDARYENKSRIKRGEELMEPLYTIQDVPKALGQMIAAPYERWIHIEDGIKLLFRDAGHILGSATVTLEIKEDGKTKRLGFTGDIGRPNIPILRDPQPMPQVDYLISECTYGGKNHIKSEETKERLYEIIHSVCVKKKGKVIIPAFSVGRTQLLVHALDQLENEGRLPRIPVYVDSPLAVNATEIFQMHPECYDEELLEYIQDDPNPFGFNNLHYIRKVEKSKALNRQKGAAIIISASGMVTAGRIMHHIANNVEDSRNAILIVGYCARGTLGQKLVDGAKKVRIHRKEFKVNAKIIRLNSMSAHAGQDEMTDFISNQDTKVLQHIFLVHGNTDRAEKFQEHLTETGYKSVIIPNRGEIIDLK